MPDTTTQSAAKKDLAVTRVFEAPVEFVWKAWTDPVHVMRWWGPEGFTAPSAKMDFREDGTSLVCMRAPKEYGGRICSIKRGEAITASPRRRRG